MALNPRINKFREIHPATTSIDATSGDKILVAEADVDAGKILVVLTQHFNSDVAQDFELKASGGNVLARFHLAAQGNNNEAGGGLGVFACPAGEGLTVNFAAAAAVCNLVSGISEVLYRPSGNPDSGPRFKTLLENYFPWEKEERRKDRSKLFYKYIRNPLAHELGLDRKTRRFRIVIGKAPLSVHRIEELESSVARPQSPYMTTPFLHPLRPLLPPRSRL